MRLSRADIFGSAAILILSVFFVFDLFLTPARLATFDAPYHITNMAQYFLVLKEGDFPVVWNNGIGNYGLPMAIVSHQLTSYLGGILIFLTQDPLISYKLIALAGIFLSSLFFYIFLRIYFLPLPAFASIFLYTFSSYKIINFYIRGALPELFSAAFLPLILIGMYLYVKKRRTVGLFLTSISFFLLALNHPMMLFIYSFIYAPYLVFLLIENKKAIDALVVFAFALIGVGMASYYLIPLNLEIKYFYYGQVKNHLTPGSFLLPGDFIRSTWPYFTNREIFPRGHIIFPGIIEIISIALGTFLIGYKWVKEKNRKLGLLEFSVSTSIVLIIFMTPLVSVLYEKINVLSSIQFPWRMLSAFLFIPPIIYAVFFTKINKKIFIFVFILLVAILQFPQLYGKNYIKYSKDLYYFSKLNPHSVLMNPIWTGKSEDYPVKKIKPEIVEGKGSILEQKVNNSSRKYTVEASTPIKMVDYTFYFPGWNLYIDQKLEPIQFQDPSFRGVITYQVPAGTHRVDLKFEDTKVRKYSKILSVFFASILIVLFIFRKKIAFVLKLKNENA